MEKYPAFCMDYVHYVAIPEDFTPEKMTDLGSSYEYRFDQTIHFK